MARMGEEINAHTILVDNSAEKRQLSRPKRGWRVILKEIVRRGVHWVRLARNRGTVVGSYEHEGKAAGPAQCILGVPETVTYQTTSHKHSLTSHRRPR